MKLSIFWNNDPQDLAVLMNYLGDIAEPVSPEKYTGEGEEVVIDDSDLETVEDAAKDYNCRVVVQA